MGSIEAGGLLPFICCLDFVLLNNKLLKCTCVDTDAETLYISPVQTCTCFMSMQ